jgi:tetratricopeptide (TPR) repeat protein
MSTIRRELKIHRLFETFGSLLQIVGSIVLFPVRVLFFPIEAVLRSMGHTGETENTDNSIAEIGVTASLSRWLRVAAKWVFAIPVLLLRSPFVILRRLLRSDKRDLLFLAPAIAMICFLGFVFVQVGFRGNKITDQYRQGGYQAIEDGNYSLAKTFFTRMLSDGELVPRDQFQWANVLANTGELQRATEILDGLAPEEGPAGFQPAHQMKAINLARQIGKSDDPSLLRRLKRHLDCCDESPEVIRAWIAYFIAVDDNEGALSKLTIAANTDPKMWLAIADLHGRNGETLRRNRALGKGKSAHQLLVEDNPFDTGNRVNLSVVLTRLKEHDAAEQVLLQGFKLQPDPAMKRALASYYVMRHDMLSSTAPEFSKQFRYLEKAMQFDGSHAATYGRMTSLFLQDASDEQREAIKSSLMKRVTGDSQSALAHFSLSNLFQAEGDVTKAQWHLERAYELNSSIVQVINNLAWTLAHKKDPDLDRALELAETAIKQSPKNYEFLDTYANVLMLRKEYELAIKNFEKVLPKSRSKRAIHLRLAECYRGIDRPDLAELHEKNAEANGGESAPTN